MSPHEVDALVAREKEEVAEVSESVTGSGRHWRVSYMHRLLLKCHCG